MPGPRTGGGGGGAAADTVQRGDLPRKIAAPLVLVSSAICGSLDGASHTVTPRNKGEEWLLGGGGRASAGGGCAGGGCGGRPVVPHADSAASAPRTHVTVAKRKATAEAGSRNGRAGHSSGDAMYGPCPLDAALPPHTAGRLRQV